MDGLSYDDVEKMLEARAEAAKRPKKRPGGRYLDVIRPGAEMKRAPKAPAMVLEETTVATVTLTPLPEEPAPEEATPEEIDQLVNGGDKSTPENNADIK